MTNVEWDFGDGNTATDDQDVSHTYSGAGTYPVTADIDGDVGRLNVRVPALHLVMFSAAAGATEYTSGSIPSDLATVDASGFLLSEVVPPATFDFTWLMENAEPVMVDPHGYFGDDGLGNLIRPMDATTLRADAWGTTVTSLPVGQHTAWVQLSSFTGGSEITFDPLPDEPRLEVTYTVTATGFDPAAYTVQQVIDHVTEHPDQVQAIYDAERDGQHRVTLLSYLTGHGAEP